MQAHMGPLVTSYNIIADLTGATEPEQVVLMGGHTDSWDVGTGCMDDGGGMWLCLCGCACACVCVCVCVCCCVCCVLTNDTVHVIVGGSDVRAVPCGCE